MKHWLMTAVLTAALPAAASEPDYWTRVRTAIEKHLGKPYVWGATGMKSFDCSGFVWRVYAESGALMKRTTARKLWFSLPPAPKGDEYRFGSLVFFDDLKHVGIINDRGTFFHAESSIGTNLSSFTPYWKRKVFGLRAAPSSGR